MSINRCPICVGCGNVPGGFYNCVPGGTPTSCNTSEICRACDGRGIIYEGGLKECEDKITVLKEIRDILKQILNHQERHV